MVDTVDTRSEIIQSLTRINELQKQISDETSKLNELLKQITDGKIEMCEALSNPPQMWYREYDMHAKGAVELIKTFADNGETRVRWVDENDGYVSLGCCVGGNEMTILVKEDEYYEH